MKEYDVKITETLEKTVTVQAASQAEAEEKVEEASAEEQSVEIQETPAEETVEAKEE